MSDKKTSEKGKLIEYLRKVCFDVEGPLYGKALGLRDSQLWWLRAGYYALQNRPADAFLVGQAANRADLAEYQEDVCEVFYIYGRPGPRVRRRRR